MKTLSRRRFLRGTAGTAIALPFLEAMRPRLAHAQTAEQKCRFMAFYVPNGMHMPSWNPASMGALELSPILQPLAGLESYLTVLRGINNAPARPDGPGDHAAGTGSFLTAAHCYKTEGANIANGVSLDQLIAKELGGDKRFASLALASEGGGNAGGCDSGYSCAYSRNISWIDESTPAARETDARQVFNRMFGADENGLTPAQVERKKAYRGSILDFAREDAQRLQSKLGRTDRQKLDQYLTSVREVERQIQLSGTTSCEPGTRPIDSTGIRHHVTMITDLMVLAFQCDLTSNISYMLGNGGSNRPYPFLGISDGHHQISHHQDKEENFEMLEKIDIWEMEQVAYLLNRLRDTDGADGNLLDETLLFFSSEIQDGNSHSHFDLPILLAGGAGGQLPGGRTLQFEGAPIADLFVSMGRLAGLNIDQFGDDSTGALNLS